MTTNSELKARAKQRKADAEVAKYAQKAKDLQEREKAAREDARRALGEVRSMRERSLNTAGMKIPEDFGDVVIRSMAQRIGADIADRIIASGIDDKDIRIIAHYARLVVMDMFGGTAS